MLAMKKIVMLLLWAVLPLCACSSPSESDTAPLAYVRMPMTVEAAIESDGGEGRVVIDYTDATHYTVRYTEPEVMQGVVYERDGGDAYLCFGDSRILVTDGEACLGSLAAARLLIPDGAALCSEQKDGRGRICKFEQQTGNGRITLDGAGMPVRVEGEADGFRATLTDLTVTYGGSR